MYVGKVFEVTDEIYNAAKLLVPQLGPDKVIPTRDELSALVQSEATTLLIARYPDGNSEIAGILTLTVYRVPTGIRSIVEDVVVDEKMRRHGIAETLMNYAIELAGQAGASVLTLSSNPSREAANKLYQSMGFEKRETNSYLYKIK